MNVALCIDDDMGMLFNSRRQSRDSELIKDFVATAGENKIFINPYSEILFEEYNVTVDENMLHTADVNDFCFVEKESILPCSSKINTLIIYKWNRKYPSDFTFEMPSGFTLKETAEFKGSSHEKITKEIYVNE